MKYFLLLLCCVALATPCFAGSCQDIQESASGAIQNRNTRVSETHNTVIPDPESEREGLSQCLSSINALGESFSLGVTLPNLDQILSGICGNVDSYIQQKINDVHNQILNEVNSIGGGNLLKVYGTDDYILQLTGKIK